MPPPGARRSSQGQRSGDDEGGRPDQNDGCDTMLQLRRGRESELSNCIERGPLGIYRVQEETPNPRLSTMTIIPLTVSNNKIMTVDNLSRRGVIKPLECQFCLDHESVNHSLF